MLLDKFAEDLIQKAYNMDNVEEPLSDYLLRCEESPAALCCVVKEDKLYFRKDTKKAILGVK